MLWTILAYRLDDHAFRYKNGKLQQIVLEVKENSASKIIMCEYELNEGYSECTDVFEFNVDANLLPNTKARMGVSFKSTKHFKQSC